MPRYQLDQAQSTQRSRGRGSMWISPRQRQQQDSMIVSSKARDPRTVRRGDFRARAQFAGEADSHAARSSRACSIPTNWRSACICRCVTCAQSAPAAHGHRARRRPARECAGPVRSVCRSAMRARESFEALIHALRPWSVRELAVGHSVQVGLAAVRGARGTCRCRGMRW